MFRTLTSQEATFVLSLCEHRSFEQGEIIWERNQESVDLLILVQGTLIVTNHENNKIAEVKPGSLFGEMGCLTGHPRFVGIISEEKSTALSLTRDRLKQLTQKEPQIYTKILENAVDILAHRLTNTEHDPQDSNNVLLRTTSRW